MNAIQVLLKDHEEIKGLFSQFEEAGKRAKKKKQDLVQQMLEELTAHTQLEERIFYPAVREKTDEETGDLVLEGIEEHRVADFVMQRLREVAPDDETFDAKVKVLMESVRHHLKEEEGKLFPSVKKSMAADLDRLGAEMESLHKKLES